MKYFISIFVLMLTCIGCSKNELFEQQARHDLWLLHEDAKLPIVVEGNTQSRVFVILLHGGPGGSSQIFNSETKPFSDPLEEDYAMVYYDQRNAGLALGKWNEDGLTIEQHVEDLEKVVELLQHKFGEDIQLFLAGHSWGGYLACTYLLNATNQQHIRAWINIDGLIHRNRNMKDVLERIETIGIEQISNNINIDSWQNILEEVVSERNKNINQYNVITENDVFDLIRSTQTQIRKDKLLEYKFNSAFSSIYSDNYDPFRIVINNSNSRDRVLKEQMYDFDKTIDENLDKITIPILSIYGYYDVTTPLHQATYLNVKVGTALLDKKLLLLNKSGHSSMMNEPELLADEIKIWIEKYRK